MVKSLKIDIYKKNVYVECWNVTHLVCITRTYKLNCQLFNSFYRISDAFPEVPNSPYPIHPRRAQEV